MPRIYHDEHNERGERANERTIPEITDERIASLLKTLTPVGMVKPTEQGGVFRRVHIPDGSWRNTAYTWDPSFKDLPLRLERVAVVQTYHDWGYYGFFKPSIAEVLGCLDRDGIPDGVTHFYLDKGSVQKPGEPLLHMPDEHNRNGYHRADVWLLGHVQDAVR